MAGPKTKVMQQHAAAKERFPDAVLFFRLGDFYEMFGDDAVLVARELDLTLTSRNRGKPDEIPMAGVPHHAAHGYIARLLALGHKVAICEQMADPTKVKGIVPRDVVRVVTPGLVTERDQLEATTNNWLAALESSLECVGIALLDLSTGELRAAEVSDVTAVLGELSRAAPREVLVGRPGDTDDEDEAADREATIRAVRLAVAGTTVRDDAAMSDAELTAALGELGKDAEHLSVAARQAVGRVLRYARGYNPRAELPVHRIGRWDPAEALVLDATAQSHLEVVASLSGNKKATLLSVLDSTCTPTGARLLRRRLLAPLLDVERIRRRLDLVELFVTNPRLRDDLRCVLAGVGDLERLAVRVSLREANPRDLGALRDGLEASARVVQVLESIADPGFRETLELDSSPPDLVADLAAELCRALVERPPAQAKEGAIFRPEYDAQLAEYDSLRQSGTERMVALEATLRESTSIPTLKVRFTRVFGWYVEVTRSHTERVPSSWRRKQTVASGERYTLDELDTLADRIANAEELHRERELELLSELVTEAARHVERIRSLAARVARWDLAAALAEVAHRYDFVRPEVDSSDRIEIVDGRHPVVERLAAEGRFVPNDVELDLSGDRLWLITGPNMAGKSTLLRQVALTVILAQMGSYVPARRARIGLVDRVLSRVGASDNLAAGESTFMVEMRETAEILRSATRRSLVILDEIGRGTSTYDGLAIAWAVAEHLDEAVACRALFATHYHELTSFADASEHASNHCVSARELGDDIVFLHRLVPGAVSRSYGVAVAKLAGLPETVLARAKAVLHSLEGESRGERTESPKEHSEPPRKRRPNPNQLDLFAAPPQGTPAHREVIETLRALDVERLTPLEALQLLVRLQGKLG